MRKIYKYIIPVDGSYTKEMPEKGIILKIGNQNDIITIWILVNPEMPLEKRTFKVFGTGHNIDTEGLAYVDTCQIKGFVWHIFEQLD